MILCVYIEGEVPDSLLHCRRKLPAAYSWIAEVVLGVLFCFFFQFYFLQVVCLLQGVTLLCILLSFFLVLPTAGAAGMHSHGQLFPSASIILLDSARNRDSPILDPFGSYALKSDFLNHVGLYDTTENTCCHFHLLIMSFLKKVAVWVCRRTYLSKLPLIVSAQHYIIELSVNECPWDLQWPLYVSLKNCQLNSGLMQSPI